MTIFNHSLISCIAGNMRNRGKQSVKKRSKARKQQKRKRKKLECFSSFCPSKLLLDSSSNNESRELDVVKSQGKGKQQKMESGSSDSEYSSLLLFDSETEDGSNDVISQQADGSIESVDFDEVLAKDPLHTSYLKWKQLKLQALQFENSLMSAKLCK